MLLAAKTPDKFCLVGKFTVHVVNKLPGQMKLHCRSKNDDLGDHFQNPTDVYNFSFCDNYFGGTLFSCQLWWGNKEVGFNAFRSKDQNENCDDGQCTWEARPDGIYVYKKYGGFTKKYDWK
ncbi:hypothetical protein ACS0TY_000250 [Phlomoides rotata]